MVEVPKRIDLGDGPEDAILEMALASAIGKAIERAKTDLETRLDGFSEHPGSIAIAATLIWLEEVVEAGIDVSKKQKLAGADKLPEVLRLVRLAFEQSTEICVDYAADLMQQNPPE